VLRAQSSPNKETAKNAEKVCKDGPEEERPVAKKFHQLLFLALQINLTESISIKMLRPVSIAQLLSLNGIMKLSNATLLSSTVENIQSTLMSTPMRTRLLPEISLTQITPSKPPSTPVAKTILSKARELAHAT